MKLDEVVAELCLCKNVPLNLVWRVDSRFVDKRTGRVNCWSEQCAGLNSPAPFQYRRAAAQVHDRRHAVGEINGPIPNFSGSFSSEARCLDRIWIQTGFPISANNFYGVQVWFDASVDADSGFWGGRLVGFIFPLHRANGRVRRPVALTKKSRQR